MNQALNATQTTAADLGSATQKENQNLQLKGIPQSNKSKWMERNGVGRLVGWLGKM